MPGHLISKDKVAVRIYTEDFIIEGTVYLPKGGRLSDYINIDRKFIPITEAVVRSLSDGKEIQKMEVLMLNRNLIIILVPREERLTIIKEGLDEDSP